MEPIISSSGAPLVVLCRPKLVFGLAAAALTATASPSGAITIRDDYFTTISATLENFAPSTIRNQQALVQSSSTGNGGVYEFVGTSDSETAQEPKLEFEDRFGMNIGSYTTTISRETSASGLSGNAFVTTSASGSRNPLVSVTSRFTGTFFAENTVDAEVGVTFSGRLQPSQPDFVTFSLQEREATGAVRSTPFSLSQAAVEEFGLSATAGVLTREVQLNAGETYRYLGEARGRSLDKSEGGRGSLLSYTITAAQALGSNSESDPLKPVGHITELGSGTHSFLVSADEAEDLGTVWFDPLFATGFAYDIRRASAASVTAPSLLSVDDSDGYDLLVGGSLVARLLPGETHVFDQPVSAFTIGDISAALGLSPTEAGGFVLGIDFSAATGRTIGLTQTAVNLVDDTGSPAPVPLPSPLLMLSGALSGLALLRRRAARTVCSRDA